MAKNSRASLLDAGLSIMVRSGYNASSVRDIVAAAGLPLGTFSNHYRSKEAFALDVLDRYFDGIRMLIKEVLEDGALTPRQRLIRYFDIVAARLADDHWTKGCLVGDLCQETAAHSEAFRARLADHFDEWLGPFAEQIRAAQKAGEIVVTADPEDLARFLLSSWQGAILWMKVERSAAPLDRFKTIIFQGILQEVVVPRSRHVAARKR